MNCFLKKLFGKKCDDKKPNNEVVNETGSDQISPDSEFSNGERGHNDQSEEKSEEFN